MKPKSSEPRRRKPPGTDAAAPVKSLFNQGPVVKAAGGPATRGDSALGRVLAQLLAYFEVRTVTAREIDLIRPTHENGWLRPQIEAKLERLHPECPDHRELRRLALLSMDLLTAVDENRFEPGPAWAELEPRLLRALAYFVREGDTIPDHLPGGFDDDMREFQGLEEKAAELFGIFEALQDAKNKEKKR